MLYLSKTEIGGLDRGLPVTVGSSRVAPLGVAVEIRDESTEDPAGLVEVVNASVQAGTWWLTLRRPPSLEEVAGW